MKINKVAPYEGELIWLGEMRSGKSQKGNEWQSVDFTIRYSDGEKDRHMTFNAFGAEKVGQLMALPLNSRIRVTWYPDSREYNGKWWIKNSVIEIESVEEKKATGTILPNGAQLHPRTQAPTFPNATIDDGDGENDLPW